MASSFSRRNPHECAVAKMTRFASNFAFVVATRANALWQRIAAMVASMRVSRNPRECAVAKPNERIAKTNAQGRNPRECAVAKSR